MNNMELYNKVRSVPENAQKEIKGGRLKGMTDINPQWRIQTLTEQFGICGFGWKVEIVRLWLENGANEVTANAEIKLFVKIDGEWSDGIVGIGGSKLVAVEKDGAYTSDECYKMAVTDAISVACKMLGFGADVYWQQNRTKYQNVKPASDFNKPKGTGGEFIMPHGKHQGKMLKEISDDYLTWYLEKGTSKETKDNINLMRNGLQEVGNSDLPF